MIPYQCFPALSFYQANKSKITAKEMERYLARNWNINIDRLRAFLPEYNLHISIKQAIREMTAKKPKKRRMKRKNKTGGFQQ